MFSNSKMQVPNNMNHLLNQQQTKNALASNKAYERIRSAIGQKDGMPYSAFSNVFSLPGNNKGSLLQGQRKSTGKRNKGTTVIDTNQARNDLVLAQFKSKILQQMQNSFRNATERGKDSQFAQTRTSQPVVSGQNSLQLNPNNHQQTNSAETFQKANTEQTPHYPQRITHEQSSSEQQYLDILKKTLKSHDWQIPAKGVYKIDPDNRMSLWNMIQKFNQDKNQQVENKIEEKKANVVAQFR